MNFLKKYGYQIFKYSVYLAVFINVFLFLVKDIASSAHRFSGNYTFAEFLDAYTSTIDTGAWVILLLLFELVTYIIPKEKLKGGLQWLLRIIRGVCYIIVVSSFFGYLGGLFWLQNFENSEIKTLCEVTEKSWMIELDEFKTISQKDCKTLAKSKQFFKYKDKEVYTDSYYLKETFWLTITEVINSLAWILVVVVLEIDVWLQLKNRFKGRVVLVSKIIKNILYTTLLFAAIYWGIFGDFLEFWDAFLWIVAFVFIEMNLFNYGKKEA